MKKLLFMVLLFPLLAVSQSNSSILLNMSEFTIKPGHEQQFTEGVKAWKKCYLDNEGTWKWNMWRRVQGEGTVYVLTSTMANWAEMDDDNDPAGQKCWANAINLIMPNIKSSHFNVARSVPSISRTTPMPETTTLVNVYNFKTSNGQAFREVVDELSAAMKKAEGSLRGTWYDVQGGSPEMADYFVGIPHDNFADLDVDRDGVWTIYEKANGKAKTDALRAKMRSSLSSDWSYMYTLNKELSNQ